MFAHLLMELVCVCVLSSNILGDGGGLCRKGSGIEARKVLITKADSHEIIITLKQDRQKGKHGKHRHASWHFASLLFLVFFCHRSIERKKEILLSVFLDVTFLGPPRRGMYNSSGMRLLLLLSVD